MYYLGTSGRKCTTKEAFTHSLYVSLEEAIFRTQEPFKVERASALFIFSSRLDSNQYTQPFYLDLQQLYTTHGIVK